MKVALTVIKGPKPDRVLEFTEPRGFILGRAKDVDFQLSPDDPYVSRRHAYLEICPPSCRLRDLGSTNPSHVNGKPVTECELNDGDVLELGYTQLKVSIAAQIARYVKYCDACGQAIELLPDETEPEICLVCAEKARRAVQPAPIVVPTVCSLCWRTDLSAQANSDGRAAELQGIAVYTCEKCLPERDEWTGSVIGDYAVLRRLGEGGMGTVYLVYHRPTARLWALKQMKDLRDALLIKRFEREIGVMKELAHQNVMRCVDTGISSEGAPYLVIEYIASGCLEDLVVTSGGRLDPQHAVNLVCEVLNGLEYIHGQSIIHRDIKPPNILLR